MAKYLRTSGITASVEELIRESKERLFIVSPYLKLSDNVKELLRDKEREQVQVHFIFGKEELNPNEMSYLQSLKYTSLHFYKNLHAKCYLNERKMVISSMNLYEFSQINNKEMGLLINRADPTDRLGYDEAWKDIESLLCNATNLTDSHKVPRQLQEKPSNIVGYCIRTGIKIPFNVERPLSHDAYKSWSRFADGNFAERFCHFSGEPSQGETTVNKPILKKHWKRAKDILGL